MSGSSDREFSQESFLRASFPARLAASTVSSTHSEYVHFCSVNHEPKVLEEPADLVLNIPLDLDEQGSADEKGFDRMTVEVFDADPCPIRIA